jgi:hypothetical protein
VVDRTFVGRLAAVTVLGAIMTSTMACGQNDDGSAAQHPTTSTSTSTFTSSPAGPSDTSDPIDTAPAAGSPTGSTGTGRSATSSTGARAETTIASSVVDPPVTAPRELLVVDLAVEHRPESELDDAARTAQRARLERAMDEVVGALGSHGQLVRRLTATAQMSVRVDAEGRRALASHPLVAAVHDDTPSTADAAG